MCAHTDLRIFISGGETQVQHQNSRNFARPPRQGRCCVDADIAGVETTLRSLNTARICGETREEHSAKFLSVLRRTPKRLNDNDTLTEGQPTSVRQPGPTVNERWSHNSKKKRICSNCRALRSRHGVQLGHCKGQCGVT